jgi:hypothetical protein
MILLVSAAGLVTSREEAAQPRAEFETTRLPRMASKETARPLTAAKPAAAPKPTVTLAGCVESDEGAFVLTDASGTNAPASRSWKSGFLKKRSAPIELADPVGTLNLRQHVGRRVAATGTLIDREMRTLSVRRIGSCEDRGD